MKGNEQRRLHRKAEGWEKQRARFKCLLQDIFPSRRFFMALHRFVPPTEGTSSWDKRLHTGRWVRPGSHYANRGLPRSINCWVSLWSRITKTQCSSTCMQCRFLRRDCFSSTSDPSSVFTFSAETCKQCILLSCSLNKNLRKAALRIQLIKFIQMTREHLSK